MDIYLSENIDLLVKIIDLHDPLLVYKIFSLCDNLPNLFNLLLLREPCPELSLRDDDSTLTKFVRICFRYLYILFKLQGNIQFKYVMKVEVPDAIALMCFHLDRILWKHSKSHIIAVTSILTLRGICPKLMINSINTAKDIMKVAGITSVSEVDMVDDIAIMIKSVTGDIHICEKCSKWVCDDCVNPLHLNLSNIASGSSGSNNGSNSGSSSNEGTRHRSGSFSPRNFSPRSIFSKESPRRHVVRKTSCPKEFTRPISPKNPYVKKIALYDNFCRDVIYKGYKNYQSDKSYGTPEINLTAYDIEELMEKWIQLMDSKENYISYGNILRYIVERYQYVLNPNQLLYWDNMFSEDQRLELYNTRCEEIEKEEGIRTKWRECYNNLF